jgi:ABC-2 type transport system ATP-binding protein
MSMLRLAQLRKSFLGRPALHELSLEIQPGEIFGLLGHNGAGKSTAFGIVLGQVHPDGGEAFIDGVSVQRDRRRALARTGAIFEAPAFYDYLSGWENLRIFTGYSAIVSDEKLREAVKIVGLTERIQSRVRTYSHGMRQRLALAQALLPEPRLILLDEPTEGLDPEGIHEIRSLIQRLNREHGLTVVFSSHLLSEVEQLCHRVVILNRGRLVFEGSWSDLQPNKASYRLEVDDWARAEPLLKGARIVGPQQVELAPGGDISDLVLALVHGGIRVRGVEPVRENLESLYLKLIGEQSPEK